MPISVQCPNPSCGKTLLIKDHAGHSVPCPHCDQPIPFLVQATQTVDLPAAPAAAATASFAAPGRSPTETSDFETVADQRAEKPPDQIGRFAIRRRLGEGAFGVVYQAFDPQLEREVAVKVAKPEMLRTETRVKRFLREAKAAANLRHPNIVPVFDSGREGADYYIAYAFITGGSLHDALAAAPNGLEPKRAVRIVQRLAEALGYAHGKGIVHRDIKPANVMLDEQDEPLLMDFGLAAWADGEEKLTDGGQGMGTPAYMAPEQAEGNAGPASDQYSLGATLYELLTGRTPFVGPPHSQIIQHRTQDPPPPSQHHKGLPRDLETICLKCLEKDPARRYASCQALAEDLRRWQAGEAIAARRLGTVERLVRWVKKEPKLAGALGAVAAALVGVAVLFGLVARQQAEFADRQAQAAQRQAQDQASALVRLVLQVETVQVPAIIASMKDYRALTDPLLRKEYESAGENSREQLHASLALLPVDSGQVEYLYQRLLQAEPAQVPVIRDALLDHKKDLLDPLWLVLNNPRHDAGQRLRAACALATCDPENASWEKVSGDVAKQLLAENPRVLGRWIEALRPVRSFLLAPLAQFLADEKRSAAERRTLATIYRTYAEGQAEAFSALEDQLAPLQAGGSEAERIARFKQQTNIGTALVAMGRGEKVWPLLKQSPDPTLRSFLIERLVSVVPDSKVYAPQLGQEMDVSIRRAIILSLGQLDADDIPVVERETLITRLLELYRDDPDPGIHGAAAWVLRRWNESDQLKETDQQLATGKVEGKRQWYINKQGQTLAIIAGPVTFTMGEGSASTRRQIDYSFAMASKEVTVEQFLRFRKTHNYIKQYAPETDCPVNNVSWYDAAAYSNWLSEQEGLPAEEWCYLPNEKGEFAKGMKLAADYLKRTGYRLPTEAEWECACRGESSTAYSFGESLELLEKYAWFGGNSLSAAHPVGILKPNDLGLSDMHSNILEWCEDQYSENDTNGRVLRGGSFLNQAVSVRSASRFSSMLANRTINDGFRPTRTFR